MSQLKVVKNQYRQALKTFSNILKEEETDIIRDASIKRFEYTFDLAWKLLKVYLKEKEGIQCRSPKSCFRQAYKVGVIDYDDFWLELTDLRNRAVHTYEEDFADSLYEELSKTLNYFEELNKKVSID